MWTGQGNKLLYFIIQVINVLANPVSMANISQHGKWEVTGLYSWHEYSSINMILPSCVDNPAQNASLVIKLYSSQFHCEQRHSCISC